MAQVIDLREQYNELENILIKSISSGNLNFLLGAGCSYPAISTLGITEKEIDEAWRLDKKIKGLQLTYKFLSSIIKINSQLISGKIEDNIMNTRNMYISFLTGLQYLLQKRSNTLHFKLINIFTTNYDLFLEDAGARVYNMFLNDGFFRNTHLQNKFYFSTQEFFNYRGHLDALYDYKIDLPIFNLIKLHGSLSWKLDQDKRICFNNEFPKELTDKEIDKEEMLHEYNTTLALVLPNSQKHRDSVMMDVYYDLIRVFSYELERPNSLFLSIGFSFKDEHLAKVINRGLRNPSLLFVSFAYNEEDLRFLKNRFKEFNNFIIVKNTLINEKKESIPTTLSFQDIINILTKLIKKEHII